MAVRGTVGLPRWSRTRRVLEIRNPWWTYRKEEIRSEDGRTGEYHAVHSEGSSMVVPVEAGGRILLVRQFRYLNGRDSLEFPCGSVKAGSNHDATAAHELAEETGRRAESLERVGEFNPCNGMTDEICAVYVARRLAPAAAAHDPTEDFELQSMSPGEIDRGIARGEIWDGMTIASWAIARRLLGAA